MRNKLTHELAVCGFNAVSALSAEHPDRINRLFLREDRMPFFAKICKKLAEQKHPYKLCEDEELERVCKSPHHQGVVAMIEEPEVPSLTEEDLRFWAKERKTGLVLHSIGNDLNLGAIVRTAAFFEVHCIVICGAEVRLTTAAYRAAEGGMEFIAFRKVQNAPKFLAEASKRLVTIGAEPRSRFRIQDLESIVLEKGRRLPFPAAEGKRPGLVLALGNEETGLPAEIKTQCLALVRIPGTGVIESLNVAQAAALFLHKIFSF
jgi:TrmH RNA methyltransferase